MQNTFFKNFLIYFSGSMVVSVINYAFYPIIGRLLSVQEFGEMQILIALVTQAGLMLAALATVITHVTASAQSDKQARETIIKLRSVVLILIVPLLVFGLLTIPFLQSYLHYDATLPFVVLFASVFVSVIATFNNATLQGQKRFKHVSYMGMLQAGSKLVIAVALIYLGLGVLGGMLGVLFAGIVGYIYTIQHVGKWSVIKFKSLTEYKAVFMALLPELRYGALSLVVLTSMAILFTIDVLAVKHYFDAYTAGLYAGISTIAKIAYFVLTPMSTVLLPSVASEKGSRTYIVKTAAIVLLTMSAIGLTIVYFTHELITSILFGERFASMSHLLPSITLAMVLLAILYNMVMYGLALRAKVLGYALPLGAITVIILNTLRHATLQAIVYNLIAGTVVVMGILAVVYLQGVLQTRHIANKQ